LLKKRLKFTMVVGTTASTVVAGGGFKPVAGAFGELEE